MRIHHHKMGLAAAMAAILVAAWPMVLNAQHHHSVAGGPPPPVTLSVGSVEGASGAEVTIPISIKGAVGLGAAQMALTYDPTVLEAKSVEKGPLLAQGTMLDYPANPPASGRLGFAWSRTDVLTGDGVVVLAHFLLKGGHAGQKIPVGLADAAAWGMATHLQAQVTTLDGEVTVAAMNRRMLAEIIAGAALLLLVLRLVFGKRKARPAADTQPSGGFCGHCGSRLAVGAKFCASCGKPI